MADFSPFPELTFEDLETLQNLDPEQELQSQFAAVAEPVPVGGSPRIDYMSGDLAVTAGGYIPMVDEHDSLAQWAMQTCLTEKFECPLVSEAIGLEVRQYIGETITTALLMRIAAQVPPALKAHDRIERVYIQRVFALGNDIYMLVLYITDDQESSEMFFRIAG